MSDTAGVIGRGGDALGPAQHAVNTVQLVICAAERAPHVFHHRQRRVAEVCHHRAQLPQGAHQRHHRESQQSNDRQAHQSDDQSSQIDGGHICQAIGARRTLD